VLAGAATRPVHDHVGRPRHGSASYERSTPEQGVLYKVLQEHLETFLADAAEAHDGAGVPKFVEKELRAFLSCGVLARGFAHCRCTDCGFERIVGLSCKGWSGD
jgi:Transposase zinc-binding domain